MKRYEIYPDSAGGSDQIAFANNRQNDRASNRLWRKDLVAEAFSPSAGFDELYSYDVAKELAIQTASTIAAAAAAKIIGRVMYTARAKAFIAEARQTSRYTKREAEELAKICRKVCFVAGTPVLVHNGISAEEITGAGDGDSDEPAGPGWQIAAFAVGVGLVASEFSGRRKLVRRRREGESFLHDHGLDAPALGNDDMEDFSARPCIINQESAMGEQIVFEFSESTARQLGWRSGTAGPATAGESGAGHSAGARRSRTWRWLRGIAAVVMAACVARALWGAGDRHDQRRAAPTVSGSNHASVPIESIRVGQRVMTDPADRAPHQTEVDPATWRLLRLRAEFPWDDGAIDVIEAETIQPPDWVEQQNAQVGAKVNPPLDLVEMGLPENLVATVVENRECPPVEPGPGCVVLTTVNHLNNYVFELSLQSGDGRTTNVRPTGFYRFYSEDRAAWVSAEDIRPGDVLQGADGALRLMARRSLPGVHRVYNMTVEREHVYRVSTLGALVHNNGCSKTLEQLNAQRNLVQNEIERLEAKLASIQRAAEQQRRGGGLDYSWVKTQERLEQALTELGSIEGEIGAMGN